MPWKLPLSESTVLILLSLTQQACHGYAILKEVENLSEGRVVLSTGTLYGALQRLEDEAWIRRVEGKEDAANLRRGASYELTGKGRRGLAAECDRMRHLARLGRQRLALEVEG